MALDSVHKSIIKIIQPISGAYWESRSKVSEQPSSATSANVSELIEMTSFHTVAEGELELQSGKGHQFQGMSSFNPIW